MILVNANVLCALADRRDKHHTRVQPGSSLLAWEACAAQQMWDACEQTPGCRREYLGPCGALAAAAQDFDLYGWRRPCRDSGERGGGSAHRLKLFGRDAEGRVACTADFGTIAS